MYIVYICVCSVYSHLKLLNKESIHNPLAIAFWTSVPQVSFGELPTEHGHAGTGAEGAGTVGFHAALRYQHGGVGQENHHPSMLSWLLGQRLWPGVYGNIHERNAARFRYWKEKIPWNMDENCWITGKFSRCLFFVYFSVAMLSYQRVNAVCSLQSTRKHGEILDTSWELTVKSGTQSTTSCNQPSNIDVYSAKDGDPDLDYIIFLLTGIQPLTMPGIHIP